MNETADNNIQSSRDDLIEHQRTCLDVDKHRAHGKAFKACT